MYIKINCFFLVVCSSLLFGCSESIEGCQVEIDALGDGGYVCLNSGSMDSSYCEKDLNGVALEKEETCADLGYEIDCNGMVNVDGGSAFAFSAIEEADCEAAADGNIVK